MVPTSDRHMNLTRKSPREESMHSTCFDHVVHGRKPLVHRCAYGAEDEQGREVDIAHQRPSEQAPMLVAPVDTAGDEEHEPVRPRQIHKLVPPSVHYQSDIEPCGVTGSHHAVSYSRHLNGHTFSRTLAFFRGSRSERMLSSTPYDFAPPRTGEMS